MSSQVYLNGVLSGDSATAASGGVFGGDEDALWLDTGLSPQRSAAMSRFEAELGGRAGGRGGSGAHYSDTRSRRSSLGVPTSVPASAAAEGAHALRRAARERQRAAAALPQPAQQQRPAWSTEPRLYETREAQVAFSFAPAAMAPPRELGEAHARVERLREQLSEAKRGRGASRKLMAREMNAVRREAERAAGKHGKEAARALAGAREAFLQPASRGGGPGADAFFEGKEATYFRSVVSEGAQRAPKPPQREAGDAPPSLLPTEGSESSGSDDGGGTPGWNEGLWRARHRGTASREELLGGASPSAEHESQRESMGESARGWGRPVRNPLEAALSKKKKKAKARKKAETKAPQEKGDAEDAGVGAKRKVKRKAAKEDLRSEPSSASSVGPPRQAWGVARKKPTRAASAGSAKAPRARPKSRLQGLPPEARGRVKPRAPRSARPPPEAPLPPDDVERPVAPDAAYYAELHRRAAELARSPDFKDAKSPAGSLLYLAEAESAFVEDKVAIRAKHSEEGKEGADSRLLMVREVGLRGTKVNLARRIKPDATAEGGESPPSPTSQKGALVTSGTCASAPPTLRALAGRGMVETLAGATSLEGLSTQSLEALLEEIVCDRRVLFLALQAGLESLVIDDLLELVETYPRQWTIVRGAHNVGNHAGGTAGGGSPEHPRGPPRALRELHAIQVPEYFAEMTSDGPVLADTSWLQCIADAPRLRRLCIRSRAEDLRSGAIVRFILQHSAAKRQGVGVGEQTERLTRSGLQRLEVEHFDTVTPEVLEPALRLGALTELRLSHLPALDDGFVRAVCRRMPQLRVLELDFLAITDGAFRDNALCGLESLEELSVRACPYVTFSEPQFRWKTLLGLKRLRLDPPGGDARFTVSMADLYNLNRFSRLTVLDLGCNVAVSKTGANAGVEKLDLRVYPLRCVRELGLYLPPAQIIWPSDVGEWHPKLRALRLLEVGDVLLLGRLRGHPSLHAFAVEDALSMTAQDVAALPRIGACLRDVSLKKMHPKAAVLAARALKTLPEVNGAVEINGMSMRAWNRLEMERYCEKLKRRKEASKGYSG